MNSPVCFYCRSELDGRCSAAMVKYFLVDDRPFLVGVDYGTSFPFERAKGCDVYLVDFSLEARELLELQKLAKKLIWIDRLDDQTEAPETSSIPGSRAVDTATCELTWRWFEKKTPLPRAAYLLSLWSTSKHDVDHDVMPFQYGMKSHGTDPEGLIWPTLFWSNDPIKGIIQRGYIVASYLQEERQHFPFFESTLKGHRALCLNRFGAISLDFTAYEPPKHDIMIAFYRHKDAWKVTLFSSKVDVRQLAREFGGGGHRTVAEFQCSKLPF